MAHETMFYVLALSQKNVRLFECDEDAARAVDLSKTGMPKSRQAMETKAGMVGEQGLAGAPSPARASHGHGIRHDDAKLRIEEFFREVDKGVCKAVKDVARPLLVAAVDYEAAIFKDLTGLPNVADEVIEGNPDRKYASELLDEGLEIWAKLKRQPKWRSDGSRP